MRSISSLTIVATFLAITACVAGGNIYDDPQQDAGTDPDDPGSSGGDNSGGGTGGGGGGGGDLDVPPAVTVRPSLGVSSVCGGGVQPLTLVDGATSFGCNIAPGTTSGCPAPRPAGQTMDASYRECFLQSGQTDCQLGPVLATECPVGAIAEPITATMMPPAGQAGYGYIVQFERELASSSISIAYSAWEVGVRADGSIAWEGPKVTGTSASTETSCCHKEYTVRFPGSGQGRKFAIDLQWF